jgi:hypothetical protein
MCSTNSKKAMKKERANKRKRDARSPNTTPAVTHRELPPLYHHHPNVLRYYAIWKEDNQMYELTEVCHKRDLVNFLSELPEGRESKRGGSNNSKKNNNNNIINITKKRGRRGSDYGQKVAGEKPEGLPGAQPGVTMVLQWCHSGVTMVLQVLHWCYNGVVPSQLCESHATI